MSHLPTIMRVLELHSYERPLEALTVVERPVPHPIRSDQVVVRLTAAAVNPSDLMFVHGRYGVRKALPVVPGWEGSGVVVAAGHSLWAQALMGRRVACAATNNGDGTWAEYMLTTVTNCMPLLPSITTLQGAMMLVNPLTAWALVDLARQSGHRAVVQTAAASALGQMIARLSKRYDLPLINIVRRAAQVDQMQASGATYVLDSSVPDFADRLHDLAHRLGATLVFDAVAGELPGRILKSMPKGTCVVVYGALSGSPCQVDAGSLIFRQQSIKGFWLTDWLRQQGLPGQVQAAYGVQRLLGCELKTGVRACFPLEEAIDGLRLYMQAMSAGKILIIPGLRRYRGQK